MMPPIAEIVDDLIDGRITKQQAITYLLVHAEEGGKDIEDDFAIAALKGLVPIANNVEIDPLKYRWAAEEAYKYAKAMAEVRREKG
jgi:hypothetical protein